MSNSPDIDITKLEGCRKEADTPIMLHCKEGSSDTIVVSVQVTDVFLLLVAYYARMACTHLLLKAGTHKKPKFIPIGEVIDKNNLDPAAAQLVLPFHALTVCDTTSYLSGHSKKTALKVFTMHKGLLQGLG